MKSTKQASGQWTTQDSSAGFACDSYKLFCFFLGHIPNFLWNGRKKFSQFGHIVRKHRLVNTVSVSFIIAG